MRATLPQRGREGPAPARATKHQRLDGARMCVMMSNMRTATIRQVQHNLSEVLSWVEQGEEVQVLRRKKIVARLVPPDPRPVEAPDFLARARAVWGDRPKGESLSEVVAKARGER